MIPRCFRRFFRAHTIAFARRKLLLWSFAIGRMLIPVCGRLLHAHTIAAWWKLLLWSRAIGCTVHPINIVVVALGSTRPPFIIIILTDTGGGSSIGESGHTLQIHKTRKAADLDL